MKIVVTGADGFIGKNLIKKLVNEGNKVTCLVKNGTSPTYLENLGIDLKFGDIKKLDNLENFTEDADIIYHLAALGRMYSKTPPKEYIDVNVNGTKNVMKAARKNDVNRVLYTSSIDAVGPSENEEPIDEETEPHPVNIYGKTKFGGEVMVRHFSKKYGIQGNVIRIPTVYGPYDVYFMNRVLEIVKRGWFPKIGEGKAGFCYVKNLLNGMDKVVNKGSIGETYFISDEENYTLEEIIKETANQLNEDVKIIKIPKIFAYLTGIVFEKLCDLDFSTFCDDQTGMPAFSRTTLEWNSKSVRMVDISKAKNKLGYKPKYNLKEGIEESLNWCEENGKI